MTWTFMRRSIQRRLLRRLVGRIRPGQRGRHTPTDRILEGSVRRLVARVLTAAVPKNASGNNASVR